MISIWLIFVILILSFAVGMFVRSSRKPKGPTDPACGKCGYQVRGLTTFTCPECGSDLREVGIAAGAAPARAPHGVALAWKLVAFIGPWGVFGGTLGSLGNSEKIVMPLWAIGLLLGIVGIVWWHSRSMGQTEIPTASLPPAAPPSNGRTRNLTIVFVDMHDYVSRSARSSRDGVIDLVRNTRELIQPIVLRRRGNIVKTIGDAFLITFDSPTDAILTSREIQNEISRRNGTVGDDDHVHLRIGISTGEVALEHNDVYGDPVNIANRIQQLAQPGEILFNEATFHAMKHSEVPHELAGDFDLKGVNGTAKLFRAIA